MPDSASTIVQVSGGPAAGRAPALLAAQHAHHAAPGRGAGCELRRLGEFAVAELERLLAGDPLRGEVLPEQFPYTA
ncbi:unnamed protein product [[Actinomadura] parvosata subsp. kistnae]|uniref:hypothetical protein n=1 Tax=[Actinomadura] parvosata TaxID=1955412 RepID=UPI000D2B9A7D|nr:hypothetical protein [Nonomuraea sp. ATCC 55076]SPL96460.1 unnamed protein product [Actinomadura parvosata subsp. kistnae]